MFAKLKFVSGAKPAKKRPVESTAIDCQSFSKCTTLRKYIFLKLNLYMIENVLVASKLQLLKSKLDQEKCSLESKYFGFGFEMHMVMNKMHWCFYNQHYIFMFFFFSS